MKNSLTVLFITPSDLPIPSIFGGGMEQMMTDFININEKEKKIFVKIITPYHKDAVILQKRYKHVYFINIKYYFYFRIYNFIVRKICKYLKKNFLHFYLLRINKIILREKPDKVVIWGNDDFIFSVSKIVPKEKLIYYLATLRFNNIDKFHLCSKVFVGSLNTINQIYRSDNYKQSSSLIKLQSSVNIHHFENNFDDYSKSFLKRKIGIMNDYPVISYVGRIVESKGILTLFDAARIMLERGLNFNILLIGSIGSGFGKNKLRIEKSEYDKIIYEMCYFKNILYNVGFVIYDELPFYMSLCDIGVVPSLVEDVSPLTYFQWQSMGIPTVVSDAGGIPEYFKDDYSLMFKRSFEADKTLAKHLEFLIKNPLIRKRMGSSALRMRDSISNERFYTEFINYLQ